MQNYTRSRKHGFETQVQIYKLFFGDCLTVITKFMEPNDILNLAKAYNFKNWSKLKPLYLESVKRAIENRLQYYIGEEAEDLENFKKVMIENNAVISGSFVLETML